VQVGKQFGAQDQGQGLRVRRGRHTRLDGSRAKLVVPGIEEMDPAKLVFTQNPSHQEGLSLTARLRQQGIPNCLQGRDLLSGNDDTNLGRKRAHAGKESGVFDVLAALLGQDHQRLTRTARRGACLARDQ